VTYGFNVGPVASAAPDVRSIIDPAIPVDCTFPFVEGYTTANGVTVATGYGSTTAEGTDTAPALTPGSSTYYSVTAVYTITLYNDGNTETGYEETPLQTSQSGTVTPTIPIDTTGTYNAIKINGTALAAGTPTTTVNLDNFVMSFTTNPGIDTYVVDLSTNSNFTNKVELPISGLATNVGYAVATSAVNLLKETSLGLKSGQLETIYFRIGDRYSGDNPGPIVNKTSSPNPDGNYAYSAVWYFQGTGT
jgi:hypothetical protein